MMFNKAKWDGLSVIVHAAFMYFFLGVNKMLIGELVSDKCGGGEEEILNGITFGWISVTLSLMVMKFVHVCERKSMAYKMERTFLPLKFHNSLI